MAKKTLVRKIVTGIIVGSLALCSCKNPTGNNTESDSDIDRRLTWTDVTDSKFEVYPDLLSGIAYGGSKYVAVGTNGNVVYSVDGINWTTAEDSTFGHYGIANITYGDGRFIAVGESGRIAYSDHNAETWTAVSNSTFGIATITCIAYGNGYFIAGGNYGRMAYSIDGISWTAVMDSTFENVQINEIIFANGLFVAGGNHGRMAYSTNGLIWTAVPNTTFGNTDIYGIAYDGRGKFVASGDSGKMAYSIDAISWTAVLDSTLPVNWGARAITYGDGLFVVIDHAGNVAHSSDGEIWVPGNKLVASILSGIEYITYGGWKFVGVGFNGYTVYSSDGLAWTRVDSKLNRRTPCAIDSVAYGKSKFVAVGGDNLVHSENGISWTLVSNVFPYTGRIAYGGNTFVAFNRIGDAAYSYDGVIWLAATGISSTNNGGIRGVDYGGNRFVAVNGWGEMFHSDDDGKTWSSIGYEPFGDNTYSIDLTYGNGKFVAVSRSKVAYSVNGLVWTTEENNAFYFMTGIAFDGNKFIALGNEYIAGTAGGFEPYTSTISSADAIMWSKMTVDPLGSLFSYGSPVNFAYGDGRLVAFGGYAYLDNKDKAWTTTDRPLSEFSIYNGIAYGGGRFVVVGNNGKIAYSNKQE